MIIVRKAVKGLSQSALSRYLTATQKAVGLRGEVNVLLTGSTELRALNSRFRRKNRPTDVLSFPPMMATDELAGDVAISVEIATENSRQLRHTTADEVKILILHGVLHLAGYDHERDRGQMARMERTLRKELGLPVGLIQRSIATSRKTKSDGKKLANSRNAKVRDKVPAGGDRKREIR
jgi:probable rRNA maturation factor